MSGQKLSPRFFFCLCTICCLGLLFALAPALPGGAQKPAGPAPAAVPGIIKAEANLVLVDVIATDKKGNYIRDLEAKDFHVFEDAQEQPITSFSRTSETNAPNGPAQTRYVVLFFDNSTMPPAEQMRVREAAAKFVEKTASTDHLLAVVDFGGALRTTQNFTADVDSLKRAVGGVKFSAVQPNEPGQRTMVASFGRPSMVQTRTDFAARSVLMAIRSLAKELRNVPGRKTLILFSGGFPLTPAREAELTVTIDAANKANVAIYPVDVRGLQAMAPGSGVDISSPPGGFLGFPPGAGVQMHESLFPHESALLASLLGLPGLLAQEAGPGGGGGPAGPGGGAPGAGGGGFGGGAQSPGGSSGGGGRSPGGSPSTGGSSPGAGRRGGLGGSTDPYGSDPYSGSRRRQDLERQIIPQMIESVSTNQQVLYALATGTGGFTLFNTNDFLADLGKVAKELGEYYVLGYVPPNQVHDGSYHKIHVKVDRKGVKVRSRNGYYDAKSPDLLAGKPEGKVLEEHAASPQLGEIPIALNAPYFYTSANVARVNLAMQVPAQTLTFEKEKGKLQSQVNVLGIAYREDGSVAARFSDTLKLNLEKKEFNEFTKGSFDYQNSFNVAPGKYTLKVVLAAGGQKFGKVEAPLVIEPFDGKRLHLSGVALSNSMQSVSEFAAYLNAALMEERTPLMVRGVEIVPSASKRFKRNEKVALYVEVYEPLLLGGNSHRVGITYNVIDRQTKQQVYTSNTILVNSFVQEGNPIIPVGVNVPVDQLRSGDYRLEVRARNDSGNVSPMHSSDFALE